VAAQSTAGAGVVAGLFSPHAASIAATVPQSASVLRLVNFIITLLSKSDAMSRRASTNATARNRLVSGHFERQRFLFVRSRTDSSHGP
jgi:hypothetical protein